MNAICLPTAALCGLILFTCILPARAAERPIDPAKSSMTVRVYKTGLFSAFGHNHVIAAPISGGAVDREARRVELKVNAAALRVRDAGTSQKDINAIQKTMLGPEVLDAEGHKEIAFQSTAAQSSGGVWNVRGNLTLHGQTRPVAMQVREKNGHFTGSARVRQSDFGIKPIKVAGGAVRVKDDVRIDFDIVTR